MNIQPAHGSSFSSPVRLIAYGPGMRRTRIGEFYKSYCQSGDLTYSYQTFVHLSMTGQLINYEIAGFGAAAARFGLEISVDERGPYVTAVYFEGIDFSEYFDQVAWAIWRLAASIVPETVEPRAKILGRKGWPRYARRHGIVIGKDGMTSGWQRYFDIQRMKDYG